MNKLSLLLSFILLGISTIVCAQKVNTDSLTLVAKIGEDQLKLGKLQNTVDQKTKNKLDAANNAQQSANNNQAAAEKLSDDPQNKQLAKKADDKAGDAKSDAKKARKESGRLDDLNKEISDLKQKIAVEQAKLNTFIQAGMVATPAPVAPVLPDTTTHP